MSKDLKSMIDKAEEEDKSRAYMEKTIDNLKIEIVGLQKKLEEKKTSFKIKPVHHEKENDESEEILILKNMINSLRQEITHNQKEKEVLQEMVNGLSVDLEEAKEKLSESMKNDLYIKTQNSLNNLIQDYGRLEKQNIKLVEQIAQLNDQVEESRKNVSILQTKDSESEKLKDETYNLKGYIKELESANKSLETNLEALEMNKVSVEALNQDVELLKKENMELENRNRFLNENLYALKRKKLKINVLETSVLELNQEIENLRKTNKELRDKDTILLAKTINAMSSSKKLTPSQKETENSELKLVPELETAPKPKPEPESEPEIWTDIKSEIETKTSNFDVEIEKEISINEKKTITDLPLKSEHEIVKEDIEDISSEIDSEGGIIRKWHCPNCGNTNKSQIREQDDKTRIIYSYPRIYGKKYICGQCGKEWR
ncbi:MAG: hypothetical protein ACTSV5_12100 [Promethearchaeota archaeon]